MHLLQKKKKKINRLESLDHSFVRGLSHPSKNYSFDLILYNFGSTQPSTKMQLLHRTSKVQFSNVHNM